MNNELLHAENFKCCVSDSLDDGAECRKFAGILTWEGNVFGCKGTNF